MKILDYDSLIKDRNLYSNILNKSVIEYIDSLLNLEIPVFDKYSNDILIDVALSKLEFYRNVVAYNILENSKEIVELNDNYYSILDTYNNNYFVCTQVNGVQSVLYNYNFNDDKLIINLYGETVDSLEDRKNKLKDLIQLKKDQIYDGASNSSYSTFIKSHEYFKLAYQLKELNSKTIADLTNEYNQDVAVALQRKNVLEYFLDMNSMDIYSDFIYEDDKLVSNYSHSKILVRDYKMVKYDVNPI